MYYQFLFHFQYWSRSSSLFRGGSSSPSFTLGSNPLFTPGSNPLFTLGSNPLFTPGSNPLPLSSHLGPSSISSKSLGFRTILGLKTRPEKVIINFSKRLNFYMGINSRFFLILRKPIFSWQLDVNHNHFSKQDFFWHTVFKNWIFQQSRILRFLNEFTILSKAKKLDFFFQNSTFKENFHGQRRALQLVINSGRTMAELH